MNSNDATICIDIGRMAVLTNSSFKFCAHDYPLYESVLCVACMHDGQIQHIIIIVVLRVRVVLVHFIDVFSTMSSHFVDTSTGRSAEHKQNHSNERNKKQNKIHNQIMPKFTTSFAVNILQPMDRYCIHSALNWTEGNRPKAETNKTRKLHKRQRRRQL